MKKTKTFNFTFAFLLVLAIFTTKLNAQEVAYTKRGDTVVLYDNGLWDYYSNFLNELAEKKELTMNEEAMGIPEDSKAKINGKNNAYELWYNDQVWKRVPAGSLNPEADIALKFNEGDAYAMIIYEEVEIQKEYLVDIALENAKTASTEMEKVKEEYRMVNGDTVICMQMDGSTQGMKLSYLSYYYSSDAGSIQFHTFTGQKLMKKYKAKLEDVLNGLVTKD